VLAILFAADTAVHPAVTTVFALLLVGLIACLALEEKLHAKKSVIAGVFAIVCLLLGAAQGILPFQKIVVGSHLLGNHSKVAGDYDEDDHPVHVEVPATDATDEEVAPDVEAPAKSHAEHPLHVDGHEIGMPVYIPAIDWGVIAIIFGSSLFVDVTSKTGLFTWIAIRVTKASRGDPLVLLISYSVMTVVFSAVLNNVTAMIIVGSLTVVSLEKLGRRQQLLGFLLVEALLTNVGGLLTLISSVPNIIVGTAAGISFVEFFVKASPYVLLSMALTIWLGAWLFKIKRLATKQERTEAAALVESFDENDGIESWGFFYFGAVMLGLFIVTIALTSYLPYLRDLEMGFVAMMFAAVMLLRYKAEVDQFYRRIDWDLLGFFVFLFVVIYTMEHALVLQAIGGGLQWVLRDITAETANPVDAAVLLIGAAGFSSVTDNIPLAAMLANILTSLGTPPSSGLWWSVIFGANLGGNLTPIGSASTLVAVTLMHKHKVPISFASFVKMALPYAAMQIALAVVYVLVVFVLLGF
jgi:Na+/H+ antiporter NhaD/arsenite permease-like protein